MESKASEGNELGAVQYVSEITGADIKTVANWFIFMLIFVFDPLAITLVIATNQAFAQRRPKVNIYGEPKPIEPESITNEIPLSVQIEKERILNEISRVERSGGDHASKGRALEALHNQLSSLSDLDSKTY